MIAYVLLILIAIGLSAGVYSWLKYYVPKDKYECPSGASLVIKKVVCGSEDSDLDSEEVEITFENKGRFDIDGAYIRISNVLGREPVLEIKPSRTGAAVLREPGFFYFTGAKGLVVERPEQTTKFKFDKVFEEGEILKDNSGDPIVNTAIAEIQIIPFVEDPTTSERAMCTNAVVSRRHSCST